jgi:endonuclease YncB( thermonuclease family)
MDSEHNTMVLLVRFFAILFILFLFIFVSKAFSEAGFNCAVTTVIDGDTVEVFCPYRDPKNVERVRLIGVQTPERGEKGYYKAAFDLMNLVGNNVSVERFGRDRYGRTLGLVESSKGCVNVEMRRRYSDTKYDRLLTKKQKNALEKRGWK